MGAFWWIAALIPLIGAIILLVSPAWPIARWEGAKSTREIGRNWTKFGIYLLVNIIACILFAWGSWYGAVSKTKFKEVWNLKITGIRHETEWTTSESHTRTVDDGDGESHTEIYHTTEHHGPYWYKISEYGKESGIDESEYNSWKKEWKTEKKTGEHKGSSAGFDRSIDGTIFSCSWPRTFETIYPETEVHSYVNKIRVSNSVLKYGESTPAQKAMYYRPVDKGNTLPVVNYGGQGVSGDDMLYLRRVSASFGSKCEIHPMLVVLGKDADRKVVEDILSAWQGPNKNEMVTFVSLDGKNIRWVEVHSWMDNTTIHATLRDELMGKPFSAKTYGELLQKYVPKLWQRKHFTPINDYLHVSINPWWIVLATVLSAIMGVASYLVIERVMENNYSRRDYPYSW